VLDLSSIWRVLLVAAGFGITILVHELGHFLVAKRVGVHVERFSIGFGPKVFGFKKGGTEYRLSLLPLGGYVKMLGEHPEDKKTGDPREFYSRTPFERMAIVFAGGVAMALFAIALFVLAFSFGVSFVSSEVGRVEQYSPAYYGGLRPGDNILAINGKRDVDFEDLTVEAALADGPIRLLVKRDDREFEVEVTPRMDERTGLQAIGVESAESMKVQGIVMGSPAERAGIELHDEIVKIDGFGISSWRDFQKFVQASAGRALEIEVLRKGKPVRLTVTPETLVGYTFGWQTKKHTSIKKVFRRTPAERAGLEPGDCITEVDGRRIDNWEALIDTMKGKYGRSYVFTVEKADGRTLNLEITPEQEDERYGFRCYEKAGIALLSDDMRVVAVRGGSALEKAGLKRGDRITGVDGNSFSSPDEFEAGVPWGKKGEFRFTVERNGRKIDLNAKIAPEVVARRGVIGILPDVDNVVGKIEEGSPAERIGMQPGDRILSLDGVRVKSLLDIGSGPVREIALKPMKIAYARNGKKYEDIIEPQVIKDLTIGYIGVAPAKRMVTRRYSFLKSCAFGLKKSWTFVKLVYLTIQRMVVGKLSPKTLAGPIAIMAVSYRVTAYGITQLMYFLGILNINFAVINLLPIPILDGGLILFFVIEKIKGKPVSKRIMELAQYAGIAIIVALFVYVMYNDINRLLGS